MDDSQGLQEITQSVIEKSLDLFKRLEHQPEKILKFLEQWFDLSPDFWALFDVLIQNPQPLQQRLVAYWQDAIGLWQEQLNHCLAGKIMPIGDKRFAADEWATHPFFNMLCQHYLLAKEHTLALVAYLDYGDKSLARRIQFFTKQYLDALSPDNFLHTNPHLMAETLQSHGKNLLLGLQNFLTDIDAGTSRLIISMTDKSAFKVGENIATTPGKVIYRNQLMELIQYTPQTPQVKSVPLLIIPPWINKYYILDLSPKNSFIGWLVKQGITVFVIAWANPDSHFSDKSMADYLQEGPIEAIKAIQTQLNIQQVNTLGFCIGGTLLSMLLAYHKAQQIHTIRSATFLATMIDFSDPGDIAVFLDEKQIEKLEIHMQKKGYLEGDLMASAFNALRASDLIWAFFIRNYLHGKPPVPFDMLFWNMDTTNMPAKMHAEYLRWMYLNNDLIKPGKIRIHDTPLNIHTIDIPTFFVSTQKDHIAPWKTTYEGFRSMRGKKQFLLGGSGHIAGIVIPPGGEKYGYYLNHKSPRNPDDWLAHAQYHSGSWWPVWMVWLKKQSGRQVKAPAFSKLPLQGLMDAPGSYVIKSSK